MELSDCRLRRRVAGCSGDRGRASRCRRQSPVLRNSVNIEGVLRFRLCGKKEGKRS